MCCIHTISEANASLLNTRSRLHRLFKHLLSTHRDHQSYILLYFPTVCFGLRADISELTYSSSNESRCVLACVGGIVMVYGYIERHSTMSVPLILLPHPHLFFSRFISFKVITILLPAHQLFSKYIDSYGAYSRSIAHGHEIIWRQISVSERYLRPVNLSAPISHLNNAAIPKSQQALSKYLQRDRVVLGPVSRPPKNDRVQQREQATVYMQLLLLQNPLLCKYNIKF